MQNSNSSVSWSFVIALCLLAFYSSPGTCQTSMQAKFTTLPQLLFEQNVGQTDPQVRYLARSGPYQLYLTDTAAVFKIAGEKKNAVVRTTLQNANGQASLVALEPQPTKTNYLLGSSDTWKANITNYAAVMYHQVYPGINLKYYSNQQKLEWDFLVAPRADPAMICLNVEGAEKITPDKDGSLLLKTAAGNVRWLRPVAYQQQQTGRRIVSARYRLHGNRVSFALGAYDHHSPLVIDPVLAYGTYLNGGGFERYNSFQVDAAGFAYIVGETGSSDFPTTPGAYQTFQTQNFSGEVFVSKLSQDGSSLVWSTIIGGTGPNNSSTPNGLTLDSTGNVYVVGQTGDFTFDSSGSGTLIPSTSTFPTTPGAYNRTELAGWRYFLVKLNNMGSALDFSTFLSDQPNIIPLAVAVDAADNPYVTGYYNHGSGLFASFPATPGAFQSSYGGDNDAFVMKFNSSGTALDYATLVGGVHDDTAQQILVDAAGNATIDGPTYSSNYPITANGQRQTDEGGFITTLSTDGTSLIYSTVLNHVLNTNVKRDLAGNYYVGGSAGTDLPTTANAFQRTFPATGDGIHVGFLTKIDASGNLVYSSYLGGHPSPGITEDTQVQVISGDDVLVAGNRLRDSLFPVTDRSYEQDNCSFLASFNTGASGKDSLHDSGCAPINETNNLTVEQFRGIPLFNASQLYVDSHRNLYGINTSGQTSANAFQKTPPQQQSGDGYYLWFGKYDLTQPDNGGINLSAPEPDPFPFNSPVTFRATGRSPQCSAGVAAMRVYTQPGVAAYTTLGSTLDAYISFPVTDTGTITFNPVIVVYDNCGKAFALPFAIVVQGPPGTPPDPQIVSPTDGSVVTSPVHFVASARAPNCGNGIAAMRIYTAPGVGAFTVNGGSLDTYLKVGTGTYNTVIQAWDNCGSVYKTPIKITVE